MKKRDGLREIQVPREEYQAYRRVAEERTIDFVDQYLSGQRFPGGLSLRPMTLVDLACAVYLQGVWDGVQLTELRPELHEMLRKIGAPEDTRP